MKKLKKIVIVSIILAIILLGVVFTLYKMFKDENSLSINEKTWINNNKNSVYSIYVPNDINVFGKSGNGIFYDFISALENDLDLKLNTNVYSINTNNTSFGFTVGETFEERDLLLYTDYYVLVSKKGDIITDIKSLKDKSIGVISDELDYISKYYNINSTIKTYDNSNGIIEGLEKDEINYIIVPLNQYKDVIVNKNYKVLYFFNDLKVYYYLHLSSDETINSIMTKYYNTWMNSKFKDSFNKNNYDLFVKSLGLSEVELDSLTDKTYSLAYLVNQPYSLLTKGDFSGIVSEYTKLFSEFADVDFKYIREKNYKNIKYDIKKKNIDLYFNQLNYDNKFSEIKTNFNIEYYLITNNDTYINIDSLNSFRGTIYVEENSLFYKFLKDYKDITIKTYKSSKKVKKLIKNNNVVIVDKYSYDNYLVDNLSKVSIRYHGLIDSFEYSFKYKNNNDNFYKLFSSYINTVNPKDIINSGLNNYYQTYESGSKIVKLAKYIILLIIVILAFIILLIKNKKKIVLNTKVKKDEKIRYVDMLTSLKNRNYLNDRLEIWNQNTVYPQSVIVLDLNNVKYLNDTFGHEEGDKQIKAAANILFKTQLDNSEILRTDGNEFMIYLVSYTEKQVVSYTKKLIKEFKKLPYEYGVAIGFSMITDDLKLIEDAFNEATIQMRENKTNFGDENEK